MIQKDIIIQEISFKMYENTDEMSNYDKGTFCVH